MKVHKMGFVLLLLLLMILNGVYQNYFVSADTNVSLAVAVHNISGYAMPQGGGTITVVLFNSNYQKIIEKSNEYRGGETLVNIFLGTFPAGNYIVEVYNIPKTGLRYHEFWGSGFVKADGSPKHFYRHVPYVMDVKVNGKSVYDGLTTITYGNSVSMEVLVKNADPETKNVKVRLLLRKCGSTSYWFNEISDQKSISGGGISSFKFVINPQETGIHEFYVIVFGWNNARIITDQHNWYKAFEVKAPEVEDAEIIKFKPPSGEFKPGDELISDVMIRNTGTVTRSFWIGLSYRSPDGTWYDVPPEETRVLSPGQETTITFKWRLPADAPYGFYDAKAAVWSGYDPKNNIMIPPQYDEAYEGDVFKVVMPSHNVEVQLIYPQNGEIMKDLPIMFIVRILVDGKPAEGVRVELICTNGGTSYCHPIDGERFHYTDSEGYVRVRCFSSLGPGSTVKWYAKALYQGEEYRSDTRTFTYNPKKKEELNVDVYTDRGGQGRSVPGGEYNVGDTVNLYCSVNTAIDRLRLRIIKPDGSQLIIYDGSWSGGIFQTSGTAGYPLGERRVICEAWKKDEYGNDETRYIVKTVKKEKIKTKILLQLPPKVEGDYVVFNGKLVRDDTGRGLGGMIVTVYDKNFFGLSDIKLAEGITDDYGNFEIYWKAKRIRGDDVEIYLKFEGNDEYEPAIFPKKGYYLIRVYPEIKPFDFELGVLITNDVIVKGMPVEYFITVGTDFESDPLADMPTAKLEIIEVNPHVSTEAISLNPTEAQLLRIGLFRRVTAFVSVLKIDGRYLNAGEYKITIKATASEITKTTTIRLIVLDRTVFGVRKVIYNVFSKEVNPHYWITLGAVEYIMNANVDPTTYAKKAIKDIIDLIRDSLDPRSPSLITLNAFKWILSYFGSDISNLLSVLKKLAIGKMLLDSAKIEPETDIFKISNTLNKLPELIRDKPAEAKIQITSLLDEIDKWIQKIDTNYKESATKEAAKKILMQIKELLNYELQLTRTEKVGDITKDNVVDYKDLAILGADYGKSRDDPDFNPAADLNGDGIIDYKDLAVLGANYERS